LEHPTCPRPVQHSRHGMFVLTGCNRGLFLTLRRRDREARETSK
jgi:hypothetical protein